MIVWHACRVVAIGFLAAVTIGTIVDWTATDLASGAVVIVKCALALTFLVAVALLGVVLTDLWRDR